MLWLTKDVSIRLLARTAGRTWVRCCSGRTVRNSESLRGLRCTLQERRGRGKARALLGPLAVRTYRTGVKALSCQSRADERTRAKALSCQSRLRVCRLAVYFDWSLLTARDALTRRQKTSYGLKKDLCAYLGRWKKSRFTTRSGINAGR